MELNGELVLHSTIHDRRIPCLLEHQILPCGFTVSSTCPPMGPYAQPMYNIQASSRSLKWAAIIADCAVCD